jgi:predicted phage baseplate assembly protein
VEGTDTNLKPTDPLLFTPQSGYGRPVLRYVESVTADHDLDRTEIKLQEISLAQEAANFAIEAKRIIARYTAEEVRPQGVTADAVVEALATIEQELDEDAEAGAELLKQKVHTWRATYEEMPDTYTTLKPWLGGVVTDLERKLSALPTGAVLRRDQPNPGRFVNLRSDQPDARTLTVLHRAQPDPQTWTRAPATGEPRATSPDRTAYEKIEIEGSLLPILEESRLIPTLLEPPSVQPASPRRLARSAAQAFDLKGDMALQIVGTVFPGVKKQLYRAVQGAGRLYSGPVEVHALRTRASLFGHNASKKPLRFNTTTGEITEVGEWPVIEGRAGMETGVAQRVAHEEPDVVHLDADYDEILPGSWIVIETQETSLTDLRTVFAKVRDPRILARAEYGMTGKTTRIELEDPENPGQSIDWITADLDTIVPVPNKDFQAVRQTAVLAQSEQLTLAEKPISTAEAPDYVAGGRIELDDLYDGLESGRWLIVSGERADAADLGTIEASELVMLAGVEQSFDPSLPGDTPHTTLILANDLAYSYKRDSAAIYGNVVKATHGETREEVLGSGDGTKKLQAFTLKQLPLTHVAAPTPDGAASTLEVRVNDVLWHEAEGLVTLEPQERGYITETDDEDKTTVTFGDGEHGARLPTGLENVAALYRSGIGKSGNVDAEKISLLATKPLGVKSVLNPLPASGGADRESRDQARRNAPLAVMALDRLVSVQDYADFATTFAGIAKASAVRLSDGRRQLVHLTIAGADDMPIDENSDLYHNFLLALQRNGDPYQPFQVDLRELMLLVTSAKVRLQPDYEWDSVEPEIRSALLDAFSFEERKLGQDVLLSELQSVIQGVEGVGYSDVDLLDIVSETEASDMSLLIQKLEKLTGHSGETLKLGVGGHRRPTRLPGGRWAKDRSRRAIIREGRIVVELARSGRDRILPAQMAVFSPDLPDTLILTELT